MSPRSGRITELPSEVTWRAAAGDVGLWTIFDGAYGLTTASAARARLDRTTGRANTIIRRQLSFDLATHRSATASSPSRSTGTRRVNAVDGTSNGNALDRRGYFSNLAADASAVWAGVSARGEPDTSIPKNLDVAAIGTAGSRARSQQPRRHLGAVSSNEQHPVGTLDRLDCSPATGSRRCSAGAGWASSTSRPTRG